ncbi:MAG: VCBS repeat-containing protein [Planctomycetes bacterium]|nr:VCBS repeat-containing protein [Planctomycetota bacterium]
MIGAFLVGALGASSLVGDPAGGPNELARIARVTTAEGWSVGEVALHDLDGDGEADLCLSLSGPGGARRLEGRTKRKTGVAFQAAPDRTVDLPRDVVAWALADVHADPGDEFVLFGPTAVFAVRPGAPEAERFAKLATVELLWQSPEGHAFGWQDGVLDVDGDGLDDLVVPGPGFERVLLQRRDAAGKADFARAFDLVVGETRSAADARGLAKGKGEVRQPGGKRSVSVSFGGEGFEIGSAKRAAGTLLAIDDSVPAGRFHDWDGDGDSDALFLRDDALVVFRQEPRGTFPSAPSLVLDSPVVRDRSRALDLSFDVWSRDLDRDGRVDVVVAAGDRRSKEPRTQVQTFLQARGASEAWDSARFPLFGPEGTPSGLLVLAGLGRLVEVRDVDGDGRDDLVAVALKADLIDELRASASETIDMELYVFRGAPLGFEKKPALVRRVALPASGGDRTVAFAGDVTGDGVAELFVRDDAERLRVLLVRRGKAGALELSDRPIWELSLERDARVVLPERLGAGSWDLFAWTAGGVTCASFR